jgi:hypothetical protein
MKARLRAAWETLKIISVIAWFFLGVSGILYDFVGQFHDPLWWRQLIAQFAFAILIAVGVAIVYERKNP